MQRTARVSFDFPFPDERVFRYASMADVLHHLVTSPHERFTMQHLADLTGYDPSQPPQSPRTAIHRCVDIGLVGESVEMRLVDLWEANRTRTSYQDAIATEQHAVELLELGQSLHRQVLQLTGVDHECVC
jgi:hypothetical protein